jgi:glyoxylase-like metal-dependent hydrolase (beta-lactamase superfamily II)
MVRGDTTLVGPLSDHGAPLPPVGPSELFPDPGQGARYFGRQRDGYSGAAADHRSFVLPEEVAALRRSGIDPSRFVVEAIPFVGYDPESYQRAPVQPTRLVSEGDVVETGDGEFQVLHLPGHSPRSIALWERSSRLLLSGDAIYDGIIVDDLPGSGVQSCRATMKRIESSRSHRSSVATTRR